MHSANSLGFPLTNGVTPHASFHRSRIRGWKLERRCVRALLVVFPNTAAAQFGPAPQNLVVDPFDTGGIATVTWTYPNISDFPDTVFDIQVHATASRLVRFRWGNLGQDNLL